MLEIANKLLELSNLIGNNASVEIQLRCWEKLEPEVVFRVDWPNDLHFMKTFSFVRLKAQPNDILKIIAYHAKKEYEHHLSPR